MSYLRAWAHVSGDKRHRYFLGREWNPAKAFVHFVMLNPSTADGAKDDPTIRKCVGFADRLGFGGIFVTNLASFRATDPMVLLREPGEIWDLDTDSYIRDCAVGSKKTIVAWGAKVRSKRLTDRAASVLELLRWSCTNGIEALATTPDYIPRHPLMLGYSNQPKLYSLVGVRNPMEVAS